MNPSGEDDALGSTEKEIARFVFENGMKMVIIIADTEYKEGNRPYFYAELYDPEKTAVGEAGTQLEFFDTWVINVDGDHYELDVVRE